MYPLYRDIREKLGIPKWIDRNGVPRYSEFSPDQAAEIYCDWVALMEVECQCCQKVFLCANAASYSHRMIEKRYGVWPKANTPEEMLQYVEGWGDAPWHDADGNECGFSSQCAGTTMTTDHEVIKVWRRDYNSKDGEFPGWVEVPKADQQEAPQP
jgi:hypothetical protein